MESFLSKFIGPRTIRVIYDVSWAGLASVLTYFLGRTAFSKIDYFGILFFPFLLVIVNGIFGVYSRLRASDTKIKIATLIGSFVLIVAISAFAEMKVENVLLWTVIASPPILLARVFLYIKTDMRTFLDLNVLKEAGPVVVVGGAGYIGTHLVEQLLARGGRVRVLDRLIHGKASINDFLQNDRFELVEGDATDITKLLEALRGASAVVHLGGLVGDPACAVDENFTRHANVIATRMVRDAACSLGVRRFIFASSCSVYGSSTGNKEMTEESPLNPVSLYARTKIDSERDLLQSSHPDFCVTILRFATVFGHSRRPRFDLVANLFTAQALIEGKITVTGSNQWRPFVHARDLAKSIVGVLCTPSEKVQGQIFNVGDRRLNMTIGQLAEKVQKIVSAVRPVEIIVKDDIGDRRNYAVSFDKFWRTIKVDPFISLENGIVEIMENSNKGFYKTYTDCLYSNVEMTRQVLPDFWNPENASRLYKPLVENLDQSASNPVLAH